jgi:hypothetical protein
MHIAKCFDSKESSSGHSLNHIVDTPSKVHILGSQKSLHLKIQVKLLQYYCLNCLNLYPTNVKNWASSHQYSIVLVYPTRCVTQFIYIWKLLYIFRVVLPPIISSAYICIYSIWYLSHRYCYLPLSWKSWNRFECAVGGLRHPQYTQIPDAVDAVVCAPDDGWKYHPKHVEQFPDINK